MGFSLMARFNVLLDYPHSKIIFLKPHTKPTTYNIQNWIAIPFTGHLFTRLNFNNKPVLLSWDTGALPSVIKKSYASQFDQKPCPTDAPYARRNCISVKTTSFTTLNGLKLPDNWFVVTNSLPSVAPFDGLIGANFYANNPVYFDFDHHVICVAPSEFYKPLERIGLRVAWFFYHNQRLYLAEICFYLFN